ncbi:MAG TPA: RbsD/FucU domain-containing protein [Geminicoccus sp.]|jgi:L-fucose mutarotase|uniref:RbsD/FucU family protein n=1 Tax=Geminicoccus sp. TaxID=2024832 RepID=UPI002E31C9EB|nr:RbsD/FucU domain-containing protein [Geminicoccus sp.]HEX2527855.1 RbsD/FucU domain-containing protein [Geminicoccus sp.]
MLIGINPHLSGDLLALLRDMGHGDRICLADRNFPGPAMAADAGVPLIRTDLDTVGIGRAILSVFPLDGFVRHPVMRMEISGAPDEMNEAHTAFLGMMHEVAGPHWTMGSIERFAFYPESTRCRAIVWTLDNRAYANFILTKGVIAAGGKVAVPGPAEKKALGLD